MRDQVCSDSICGQKQSFLSYLRGRGYYFEKGWYCSRLCFLRAITVSVRRSLELPTPEILIHRRGRIGAILIQKGLISRDELQKALQHQQSEGGLIGEWLLKLTEISEAELMAALSEQQGVPWLAKAGLNISKSLVGLLPRKLCIDYRIFPFEFSQGGESLRVAAKSPIDGLLLHMLRTMLGYEIQFFIVSDSVFEEMIENHMEDRRDAICEETLGRRSAGEISDLVLKRMDQNGLNNVSLHFFNDLFWVRGSQGKRWQDFFISIPPGRPQRVNNIAGLDRHFLPKERAEKAFWARNQRTSVGT